MVEEWVTGVGADFEEVWDFNVPDLGLEWQNEDSEVFFHEYY